MVFGFDHWALSDATAAMAYTGEHWMLPGAIAAAAVWIGISINNRIVALNDRCTRADADIDALLRRRADLIPSLVECVRTFTAHEATILSEAIEARKDSVRAALDTRSILNDTSALNAGAIINLAEQYPDLAASPHFRELRQELVATEERLTAARRFFNLAVGEYNTSLGQFPASLIARFRAFSNRASYDLGGERAMLEQQGAIRF
jgi:LemA protein